jgi:hypothetical protein
MRIDLREDTPNRSDRGKAEIERSRLSRFHWWGVGSIGKRSQHAEGVKRGESNREHIWAAEPK